MGGTLYNLQPQVAITNITAAQSLTAAATPLAIPPGLLNVPGKILRLTALGIYTQISQANALTFALTFGGVTLMSLVATIGTPAVVTNGQFDLQAWIMTAAAGASGTLEVHATVDLQLGASNILGLSWFADVNTAPSSAVDLTPAASGGSTLGFTLAASSAIASAQLRNLALEVIN